MKNLRIAALLAFAVGLLGTSQAGRPTWSSAARISLNN
ncbi:hypothetical protein CAter10_3293 [Collimonas arenae]|nr:hypothetical protein CAter10_3293 [Collimonas arenae]